MYPSLYTKFLIRLRKFPSISTLFFLSQKGVGFCWMLFWVCYIDWFSLLGLLLSRFSRVRLCVTPETAAQQAPPSMGFSRQEYWSELPLIFSGWTNFAFAFCWKSFFCFHLVQGLGEAPGWLKSCPVDAERGFRCSPDSRGVPQRPLGS